MLENINIYLRRKWKPVAFALLSLIMYYLISFTLHPYDFYWKEILMRPIWEIITDVVLSFIFCLMISQASIQINKWLDKALAWTEKTVQRAIVQTLLLVLFIALSIAFQIFISILIYGSECDVETFCDFKEIWGWITGSIAFALIISAVNTGSYFIENWKKTALESSEHKLKAEKHQRAATEAELHALKLQIDPHFVFNNLSVLSELILEDQQLGYNYSENFSKFYRYLLVNSKKDLILLSEEIKFLKSYIFLIQHRVGSGVVFDIDVDAKSENLYLPPLTLQFLVENALKHNRTLKTDPLKISIYTLGETVIVVENKILPIQSDVHSSGVGLSNIMGRYNLLSDKAPEIYNDKKTFKVILPLIRYEE